jgi:ribosomal protein L12E/L44/L45/RPP1/RPP2
MPDPRHPQRPPQSRQPAPRPAQPAPAHDPRIVVGDPDAAAKAGTARPVRTLDPAMQAPPVEVARKIRKGETYWIMGHEECPEPRKARIIRLSDEPGKRVGVEFDEPIGGVDKEGNTWGLAHTCDGRGKLGHCLYVRADQVLDDKAMESVKARAVEVQKAVAQFKDLDEITVGPEDTQPPTPTAGPSGAAEGEDKDKPEPTEEDEDRDEDEDK